MLKLLELFAKAGVSPKGILSIPDIHNETAFRVWLQGVTKLGATLTELTSTEIDDDVSALLVTFVGDDQVWVDFYKLLIDIFPPDGTTMSQPPMAYSVESKRLTKSWDWAKIMKVVQMIIDFISALK